MAEDEISALRNLSIDEEPERTARSHHRSSSKDSAGSSSGSGSRSRGSGSRSSSRNRKPPPSLDYVPLNTPISISADRTSCIMFKDYEEGQLQIRHAYYPVEQCKTIYPELEWDAVINDQGFKDAMLEGINSTSVLNPATYDLCAGNNNKYSLRRKFMKVIDKCYMHPLPRDEGIVDEFVRELLRCVGGDDEPLDIRGRPLLYLQIGIAYYASFSDFSISIGHDLYLVVVESKYTKSDTYLNGKLQLVCGMIASAQGRFDAAPSLQQLVMYGVLVFADQFAFARAVITRSYVDSIKKGIVPPPASPLEVSWIPQPTPTTYFGYRENAKHVQVGIPYGLESEREFIVKTLKLICDAAKVMETHIV